MRRREFIAGLGATTSLALPLAGARAQKSTPVIGFLYAGSPESGADFIAAFREALAKAGYVEGRNVVVAFHYGNGRYDQLSAQAGDFITRGVDLVITGGGTVAAKAARAVTSTVPIVFVGGGEPVKEGLIESLRHPGGNITGINQFSSLLVAKRLEFLCELVPAGATIGVLVNQNNPNARPELDALKDGAVALGRTLRIAAAETEAEIQAAFEKFAGEHVDAIVIGTDAFFVTQRDKIISLAARYRIPASYTMREYTKAGGLMSYGADRADLWRQAGTYAARILKGEKAGDLPVLQPTRFELIINLKTAKALALAVPPTLLATADEVIE